VARVAIDANINGPVKIPSPTTLPNAFLANVSLLNAFLPITRRGRRGFDRLVFAAEQTFRFPNNVQTPWGDATKMRSSIALILSLFVLYGLRPKSSEAEDHVRPNIVLILADDLGWADLACYGSDLHETPNLDRLAQQGVRFTDAYSASPVCTPTRVSILTGKHPARLHMTIWRESALNRGNRQLLEPVCVDSLPTGETTVAELLRDAGYYNVHLGKWHVGRAEGYPQAHGFHRNIGGTLWGAPQTFWYPFAGDTYFKDWRYVPDLEPGETGTYLTDVLTDKAINVLRERSATEQPFYVNLWYHTVHTPIEGKPDLVRYYEEKIKDHHIQRNPYYAAMVHSLDENVGRVLKTIDELGISNKTLVVFSSDNGGYVKSCKLHRGLQVANNSPLRSGKGSCYEGGIRVPLIIRTPNMSGVGTSAASTSADITSAPRGSGSGMRSGQQCHLPVFSCDLFPTLLDAAGIERDSARDIDGRSLSPVLNDPNETLNRDALYFHYPHYYSTTSPVSAIRKGPWKLLEYYEDGRIELYNVDVDQGETSNQASSHPDLAAQLHAQLRAWRIRVGALEPEWNTAATR
tara:strand:+ start:14460 stop:16187 length:1728 start_codon:yes stop_codon:yes gene_type:complete